MIKFIKLVSVLAAALPLFWSGGASAGIPSGYELPNIAPSGYPNFENAVAIKYQRADNVSNKLTAVIKNTTGTFNLNGSSYDVNNLSYKLRANFTNSGSPSFIDGTVRINGNIEGLGANGVLFKANLSDFNSTSSLIGFNTNITFCDPGIAVYCTTNESVYLHSFGGGFSTSLKKFREDGTALTTIPVPAAVWLFGSGLLGLVSIAKRKKAAA